MFAAPHSSLAATRLNRSLLNRSKRFPHTHCKSTDFIPSHPHSSALVRITHAACVCIPLPCRASRMRTPTPHATRTPHACLPPAPPREGPRCAACRARTPISPPATAEQLVITPLLMVTVMALSAFPSTCKTPPCCEAAHARGSASCGHAREGVAAADTHSDVPTATRAYSIRSKQIFATRPENVNNRCNAARKCVWCVT